MAVSHSAGIVLARFEPPFEEDGEPRLEIMLVHPGGPFWANKDEHAWSMPKGEFDPDSEDPEMAARREFVEETGTPLPVGDIAPLPMFRAGSKRLYPFLLASPEAAGFDVTSIASNTFEMEWPPRSGATASFPEVDRAAWVALDDAENKLHKGQRPLVTLVRAFLS